MSKKILIAGAGPAGLTAAAVLSGFGFKVVICEKSNSAGGQFRLGSMAPDKDAIAEALSAMQMIVEKSGAEIRFQTEVTRAIIEKINPDIVIVATGSEPLVIKLPFISGAHSITDSSTISSISPVSGSSCEKMLNEPVTAHEVLSGSVSVKQAVAIIGGGITGVETAEFLAKQGKKVIILEMETELARELSPLRKNFLKDKIKRLEISVFTGTKCTGIGKDFIEVEKAGAKMRLEKIESVVLACGIKPVNILAETLKDLQYTFYLTGDALKPAKAIDAILSAAELSKSICSLAV